MDRDNRYDRIKTSYDVITGNSDSYYNIKVMIYAAIVRCRGSLVIFCPSSKMKEISKILPNFFK